MFSPGVLDVEEGIELFQSISDDDSKGILTEGFHQRALLRFQSSKSASSSHWHEPVRQLKNLVEELRNQQQKPKNKRRRVEGKSSTLSSALSQNDKVKIKFNAMWFWGTQERCKTLSDKAVYGLPFSCTILPNGKIHGLENVCGVIGWEFLCDAL